MADGKLGLTTFDDQSIGMTLSDPVMELVWENGQVLVRGLSGGHSGFSYPSSAPKFLANNDEDMFSAKRRRSDLCSGQAERSKDDSSLQHDHHPGLFPGIYQTDFNLFFENARNFDSGVESQVVPGCKNSSSRDGSNFIAENPHLTVTEVGNVPNANANQCLVPEVQNQDSKSERKRLGMQSFSHLSIPATLTKITKSTTGLRTSSLEGLKSNTGKPMGTTVLKPESCAKDVKCFNSQPDYHTTSTKMKFVAEPSEEAPPDEQSEAAGHKNTTFMSKQYCPDEVFAQVPVSSSANKVKEKSGDQLVGTTSMCSRASNDLTCSLKTRNEDNDLITSPSNNVEEENTSSSIKVKHAGERGCCKRKRSTEVHNMSERKRRAKINKKMRELQELIPNSDQVDKSSMLDQAIEYLKTLQLQVQIMQMGRALCTHSMMLPTGMQHIQAPLVGQFFSSFGMGMHMGSLGCNPATFPASFMLGLSGQMLPTPFMPLGPSMPSMIALPNGICGLATPGELLGSASLLHSKVSARDVNSGNIGNVSSSKMQTSSRH